MIDELKDAAALSDFKLKSVENKVVAPIAAQLASPKNFLRDIVLL